MPPKPVKVNSVSQAQALPELVDTIRTTDPETGMTTVYRVAPTLGVACTDGDQILLFTDTDGRSMRIVYTDKGPHKTPFYL